MLDQILDCLVEPMIQPKGYLESKTTMMEKEFDGWWSEGLRRREKEIKGGGERKREEEGKRRPNDVQDT